MIAQAQQICENNLLKSNGIFNFKSKLNLRLETNSYLLKTADSVEELIESCKLRHQVFYQEFQNILNHGIDVDQYDSHFDHLIIIHKESSSVIGTYRLSSTGFSHVSYTASEFHLQEIHKLSGPHLELGRACIQKEHRKGVVLSFLWRGIIEYMNLSEAQTLFGCSSIKVNQASEAALVYKHLLLRDFVLKDSLAKPTDNFLMPEFSRALDSFSDELTSSEVERAESLIPPLLKSYLRYGAKIASVPALDRDFDCIDLLTVLKKEDILRTIGRRFQVVN